MQQKLHYVSLKHVLGTSALLESAATSACTPMIEIVTEIIIIYTTCTQTWHFQVLHYEEED